MRRLLVLALVAAVGGTTAGAAGADGDPASDVLLSDNVFLSYQSPYGSAEGRALEAIAKQAKQQGFPMRVAVITQLADMGSVGGLYGKAQRYADFLASEIRFVYRGTLVIAMNGEPGGFGVHGPGATPAARRALAAMKLPPTPPTAAEHGGGMRIIDVWESEDAYRRFERDTLTPAMERAGLEAPTGEPPPLDSYDIHSLRGPAAG